MITAEKEIKLLINKKDGEVITREMTHINNIESFSFSPSVPQLIEDIYLDDDAFILKNKHCYLRMRGREDIHTITFRKEIIKSGKVEVDEITHPLSHVGLRLILGKIEDLRCIKSKPILYKPTFIEIFQTIGLKERLRISINRTLRDIFMEDVKIGRLKIDKFTYLPNIENIHYVVEIDTYKKAFHFSIDRFINVLHLKYSNKIKSITENKYLRGLNLLKNENSINKNKRKMLH